MTGHTGIIAIDPGNIKSAVAWLREGEINPRGLAYLPNAEIFQQLDRYIADALAAIPPEKRGTLPAVIIAIEQIRSYGMAVGATVFDTVHWSGRFQQYLLDYHKFLDEKSVILVPRMHVKMHLCHSAKAKDVNVNTAVADRYGGKAMCKGTSKNPGPLFGIAGDQWAALALAITVRDNLIDGYYCYDKQGRLL